MWEAKYRHGAQETRSPALLLGSAFDATLEQILRAKWRGQWTTAEQAAFWFGHHWETEMARPEVVEWDGRSATGVLDDGIRLVTAPATLAYLRGFDLAPHPDEPGEPALQVRTELVVPGVSVPVIGWIDAIAKGPAAGSLHAVDFKTARRKWPAGKERKELQARVYLGGLWQAGNSFATLSFSYVVFVPGWSPEACVVQQLPVMLSERDVLLTMEMLRRSWRQVKAEAFPPNPRSYRCKPGCPVYERCFGG